MAKKKEWLAMWGALVAVSYLPAGAGAADTQVGKPVKLVGRTGVVPPMFAAASANGYQAFAWTRFSRVVETVPTGFGGPRSWIQARLRLRSGRLTRPYNVSPTSGRAFMPAIGIDRAGTMTAVWLQQVRRGTFAVKLSVGRRGHGFGRAVTVGRTRVSGIHKLYEGDLHGIAPELAVAPNGAAAVASRGVRSLLVAVRRPGRCRARRARACFSHTRRLTQGMHPEIVFGARNTAYLVWAGPTRPPECVTAPCLPQAQGIRLALLRPGSRIREQRITPPGDTADNPVIALTPDGSAIVGWCQWRVRPPCGSQLGAGFPLPGVEVAVRNRSGAVSEPLKVSDPSRFPPGQMITPLTEAFGPTIVVNRQGEAIVSWAQSILPEAGLGIAATVRAPTGAFGPSQVVSVVGFDPRPAVDARGDTVLLHTVGPTNANEWHVRPPRGAFRPGQVGLRGAPSFLSRRTGNIVTFGLGSGASAELTELIDVRIDGP